MVVLARDIVGLTFLESKRDSIPFVYPDAEISGPITLQRFQSVTGG